MAGARTTYIRSLADVVAPRTRLSAVMEVRISLDQTDPPVGRLTVSSPSGVQGGTQSSIPFTGWLGLLHALSEALGSSDGSPGGASPWP